MKLLLHTDSLVDLVLNPNDSFSEMLSRKRISAWVLAASLPEAYSRIRETVDEPTARERLNEMLDSLSVLPMAGPEVKDTLQNSHTEFSETLSSRGSRDNGLDGILTTQPDRFSALNVDAFTLDDLTERLAQPAEPVSQVPLLDIPGSYHEWLNSAENELYDVIRSGKFILGPQVRRLEESIAQYCQCKHAVGVSSGTDALVIALMAAEIGPGDEVITTPFTFFATVGSIVRVGATPVFVDIDPVTFNLDMSRVEDAITEKTKAVIPVHLYGQCADMAPLNTLAAERNLVVIEDAAQAIGAEYKDRRAGSLGDMGCFSFFPTKNLGGFGDGGIVTTNSDALHERLQILRVHGSHPKYYHKFIGGNFRLDTLQAGVVAAKLPYLDQWTAQRQENAGRYRKGIADAGLGDRVRPPVEVESRHIYNQFVVRIADGQRDALREHFKQKKIGCEVYYPLSLHEQECFRALGYKTGDFPESERAAGETLALPNSFEITAEQQDYVIEAIQDFYS